MRRPSRPSIHLTLGLGLAAGMTSGAIAQFTPMEIDLPGDVPMAPDASARLLTTLVPDGLAKIGPFDIYPRVSSSLYYDNNISGSSNNRREDIVWTISPGISLSAVDPGPTHPKTLTLSYTPTLRYYLKGESEDRLDHSAALNANIQLKRVSLGFSQGFSIYSYPDPEISGVDGSREQVSWNTQATSSIAVGHKSSVSLSGSFNARDYDQLSRNWTASGNAAYNYQFTPKTSGGVGVTAGYQHAEDDFTRANEVNPDQTFQQLNLQGSYVVTQKINVNGSVGLDFRQYRGGRGDTINPVWNIGGAYSAWRDAFFSLSLNQQFQSSAANATQNNLRTGVSLSFSQRFLKRLNGSLGVSYYHADYEDVVTGVVDPNAPRDRKDDVVSFNASLNTYIFPNWTAGIFYSHTENFSTANAYSTRRDRAGIQTTWSF